MDINIAVPSAITHALLPVLVYAQPSLIINIGSVIAAFANIYARSKTFRLTCNEILATRVKAEKHRVEVKDVVVGRIVSNTTAGTRRNASFEPSMKTFAKATLFVLQDTDHASMACQEDLDP